MNRQDGSTARGQHSAKPLHVVITYRRGLAIRDSGAVPYNSKRYDQVTSVARVRYTGQLLVQALKFNS